MYEKERKISLHNCLSSTANTKNHYLASKITILFIALVKSVILAFLWLCMYNSHILYWKQNKQQQKRTDRPTLFSKRLLLQYNWPYRKYAIWPRDGACHANHACAALTVSRSFRQVFVFFHWKCIQVLQNSSSIKQTCLKRYHHDLLRYLVAFSKFECHASQKLRILALILFISRSISIRTGNAQVDNFHAL